MASHRQIERYLVFAFGFVFIAVLVAIALFVDKPTQLQWLVFRVVLGLAAAGIAAFIPGFLSVEVSKFLRAGGAIAIFVIIYFFSPAAIVVEKPVRNLSEENALRLKKEVLLLRGTWLRGTFENAESPQKVKVASQSPLLGQAILELSDERLRLGYQIVKYQYASFAYLMACESETNQVLALKYCEIAATIGNQFIDLAKQSQSLATQSAYNTSIADWVREEREVDRANYLLSRIHALQFRVTAERNYSELARQHYSVLSPAHKRDYAWSDSKILKQISMMPESEATAVTSGDM